MLYTETEIRRMHIEDEQWFRTSESWKLLIPQRNFNQLTDADEFITEYCKRVDDIIHVPIAVADQWLYCHYYNADTVDNYGWINYEQSIFELGMMGTEDIVNLNVIDAYQHYVLEKREADPFDSFSCISMDMQNWIQEGTWRVPPIVIDVQSFPELPAQADIKGPFQLVEGHTRLGYLLSLYRTGKHLKHKHEVYILRSKK